MNTKKALIIFAALIVIAAGSVVITCYPLKAEDTELTNKLEEIADSQKQILAEIQAIKQELDIIKIRITQNQ